MQDWWGNEYGFVDIKHPLRIFIRFGGLLSTDKLTAVICAFIILFMYITSLLFMNRTYRYFMLLPVLFVLIASAFNLYPIEARLILFLYPLFAIVCAQYCWKQRYFFLSLICIISLYTSACCIINPYQFNTSAREIVHQLEEKIEKEDVIILDSDYPRFVYYLKKDNKIVILQESCVPFTEVCNKDIENLPSGAYFLILREDPVDKLTSKVNILDVYRLNSTLVHFKK